MTNPSLKTAFGLREAWKTMTLESVTATDYFLIPQHVQASTVMAPKLPVLYQYCTVEHEELDSWLEKKYCTVVEAPFGKDLCIDRIEKTMTLESVIGTNDHTKCPSKS